MDDETTRRARLFSGLIRAEHLLKSLKYCLPHPSNRWGKISKNDYAPYTEQEWIDRHFKITDMVRIQRSALAWEMIKDFDCFDTITGQMASARPFGETDKNPIYLYGRTKRFKLLTDEKKFEVQQAAYHADDFDADFIEFAHKNMM